MKETLCDFDFELVEDVLVIYDCDQGGRSVTNDIQNVLSTVGDEIGGIGHRPVIYRDSSKTFDGIYHQGERFAGFYPVNETVLEAALAKVRSSNVVTFPEGRIE